MYAGHFNTLPLSNRLVFEINYDVVLVFAFIMFVVFLLRKQERESVRKSVYEWAPSAGRPPRTDFTNGDRRREALRDQSTATSVARMRQQDP